MSLLHLCVLNCAQVHGVGHCLTDDKANEMHCVNTSGHGVAMNNTVPGAMSTPIASANQLNSQNNILASNAAAAAAGAPTVLVAPSNVNNFQMDDVQKLKQQLQDIKEQVGCAKTQLVYNFIPFFSI